MSIKPIQAMNEYQARQVVSNAVKWAADQGYAPFGNIDAEGNQTLILEALEIVMNK